MTVVASPPWTPEEEDRLRALILQGESTAEIAQQMERTPSAIKARAFKLRNLLGKTKPR